MSPELMMCVFNKMWMVEVQGQEVARHRSETAHCELGEMHNDNSKTYFAQPS